jgi:hypothetical protein
MNINEIKAEVEAMIEQLAPVDWSSPKAYNPLGVGLTFQMAAVKLLMKPENQMAMYQNAQRNWMRMWGVG